METEIIRVFPRKTKWTPDDDLAFVGEPPLFELPNLPVYVSVTFTWDLKKANDLAIAWVKVVRQPVIAIGGPAFGDFKGDFVPGVVLDPFAGAATTLYVAARLKRDYIGIELSQKYIDNIASLRLLEVETGVPVKEMKAGQKGLF